MNKSFTLLTKAKRLTSLQMDRTLPRGSTTSLMTPSPILRHHHSSSSSSSSSSVSAFSPLQLLLHHYYSLSSSSTTLLLSYLNSYQLSSQSNMGNKYPQESGEAVEDHIREGYYKEACQHKPAKGVSDHIIPHILNLYASRATPQDFEIYAPHATFEDPLMCAHGVNQIKSAFYSLGKVFGESRIVSYTIEENVISPGKAEILIDNKQFYKFLGRDIDLTSLIKLYTEDGKIVRHEDWWDKKPIWNRETVKAPFVGRIIEVSKRASMFATHALMGFGKDPTT
ncbi:hypothetical protein Salat_0834500 [Sesamum alatum]|uniref:SnoaL-like domain-containing protein n=1 Tax=Sesamum alatum TaxID=300844 RepID=A0AAE2CQF8_9LAMI|nr:hypothetical protein Salat_0834500 [Sesamum alatum]